MKVSKPLLILLALPSFAAVGWLAAQGPVDPAAGPAPIFKTLAQVEPRIDVATLSGDSDDEVVIANAGSYYLTDNLTVFKTNGIRVTGPDVVLDLNGFQVSRGIATSGGTAIVLGSSASGCVVKNGNIRGSFANGIEPETTGPANVRVSDVSVSGCSGDGIDLGQVDTTGVSQCFVSSVGGVGIRAGLVSDSIANQCGGAGITGLIVRHSYGVSTGAGEGITANIVAESRGTSSSGTGVSAGVIATNSEGNSITGTGLFGRIVSGSWGVSAGNGVDSGDNGIEAELVHGSYGKSFLSGSGIESRQVVASFGDAESAGSSGIDGDRLVVSSIGFGGGTAIEAFGGVVTNSYAFSDNSSAISADSVSFSVGIRDALSLNTGSIIESEHGIGVYTEAGETNTVTEKFLGTD
ncbi:MAG: hypothetical protein AAGA58_19050 [Verrucomicrobiota bacterium]